MTNYSPKKAELLARRGAGQLLIAWFFNRLFVLKRMENSKIMFLRDLVESREEV